MYVKKKTKMQKCYLKTGDGLQYVKVVKVFIGDIKKNQSSNDSGESTGLASGSLSSSRSSSKLPDREDAADALRGRLPPLPPKTSRSSVFPASSPPPVEHFLPRRPRRLRRPRRRDLFPLAARPRRRRDFLPPPEVPRRRAPLLPRPRFERRRDRRPAVRPLPRRLPQAAALLFRLRDFLDLARFIRPLRRGPHLSVSCPSSICCGHPRKSRLHA